MERRIFGKSSEGDADCIPDSGEPAPGSRPRHLHLSDPATLALDLRHPGIKIGFILKKVQMTRGTTPSQPSLKKKSLTLFFVQSFAV
jgi:hypothetical protein